MWDKKLLLYAVHRGWHESISQRNHQTTVSGNKTGPHSEGNSGTEPRVQHLAQLARMLLAIASGLGSEWRGVLWGKSGGRHYSRGSPQWAIFLCCNPQACEESRPDTKKLCWNGQIWMG